MNTKLRKIDVDTMIAQAWNNKPAQRKNGMDYQWPIIKAIDDSFTGHMLPEVHPWGIRIDRQITDENDMKCIRYEHIVDYHFTKKQQKQIGRIIKFWKKACPEVK